MRRAAKVDANQVEIVDYLRRNGATVQILSMVGKGCPDLLVGYGGHNWLLECKPGDACASRQTLTTDEAQWHHGWAGQVAIVLNPTQALEVVRKRP